MIGGTRFRLSVKTRLEWLYHTVRGQVSDLSFHILVLVFLSISGLDECDFNGHLSNSSYAKVVIIICKLFMDVRAHEFLLRLWIPLVSRQHLVCFLCSFALVVGLRYLVSCAETNLLKYSYLLKATHYHFIREIPMLASYEVRTSIAAWDHKWVRQSHYSGLLVGNQLLRLDLCHV